MSTARKRRFHIVKILKKRPIWPGYSRAQNLKEIRLASEAMGVPKPPRFTAVSKTP